MPTPTDYTHAISTLPNSAFDSGRFIQEVQADPAIVTVLNTVTKDTANDLATASFKDALSAEGQTALAALWDAHSGESLPITQDIQRVSIVQTDGLDPDTANTRIKGFKVSAEGNAWGYKDISFPYSVDLESGECLTAIVKRGDIAEFVADPDHNFGNITADAAQGATEISINPASLPYLKAGFHAKFESNPADPDLDTKTEYEIVAVDYDNAKITISPGLEAAKTTADYFFRGIKYAESIHVEENESLSIGGQILGAVNIPANMKVRIRYYNSDSAAKELRFRLIYKY